jgi:hypothetical protein
LSLAGGPGILYAADPVIGLPYQWTLPGEAVLELAIAALLVFRAGRAFRLLAVFTLGFAFCGYHLALAMLDPGALCPCLGTLYGRLGIRPATSDMIARVLAAYFLLGPPMFWGMKWLMRRSFATENAKSAKTRATERGLETASTGAISRS